MAPGKSIATPEESANLQIRSINIRKINRTPSQNPIFRKWKLSEEILYRQPKESDPNENVVKWENEPTECSL